jgi:hypothetical protein
MNNDYLAIHHQSLLAQGDLVSIVEAVKALDVTIEPIVLRADTFERVEFNWHGDSQTVIARLEAGENKPVNKRGRPKLGVTAKEITLLPRHWAWLANQRGGASALIRRLIEEAMKNVSSDELITNKQNQLYSLMSLLGDQMGFEEASRALYRNSRASFSAAIETWPEDLKAIIMIKFDEISDLHKGI